MTGNPFLHVYSKEAGSLETITQRDNIKTIVNKSDEIRSNISFLQY
jgi:hypothetical protein